MRRRCKKKSYYKTSYAREAIKRAKNRGVTTLSIYWCEDHKAYHIGHKNHLDKMIELFKQIEEDRGRAKF